MTAATEARSSPSPSGPAEPPGRLLVRIGGILAWLAVACLPLAVVAGSVPVQNLRGEVDQEASEALRRETGDREAVVIDDGDVVLQDCGTPLAYVATARLDEQFETGGPAQLTEDQVRYAIEHRCRSRVADRLRPVGWLLAGFAAFATSALVLTLAGRSRAKRASWAAAPEHQSPAP